MVTKIKKSVFSKNVRILRSLLSWKTIFNIVTITTTIPMENKIRKAVLEKSAAKSPDIIIVPSRMLFRKLSLVGIVGIINMIAVRASKRTIFVFNKITFLSSPDRISFLVLDLVVLICFLLFW